MRRTRIKNKSFTNWRMGDFILQLLVVILGIVITFTVSNLVAEREKERAVEKTMLFIKDEIEMNLKSVQQINEIFQNERRACNYILSFKGKMDDANKDSLMLYSGVPFYSQNFTYTKDALEMLKAYSLIQHVKNKELVLQIVKTYNTLELLKEFQVWYYNTKEKYGDRISADKEFSKVFESLFNVNSINNLWKLCIENNDVYNLLRFVTNGANFNTFTNDAQQDIIKTINMIEKEYKM